MTLPILLSIPHGGRKKPPELGKITTISERDVFNDIDPFVIEIYDLGKNVQKVIKTEIARTFVDLNRSLQDMPPSNPDGLIKSMTCHKKQIYIPRMEPNENLRTILIDSYYYPYHREIQKSLHEYDLQLALDCHSMESTAPSIAPDKKSKERPLFCLSNQEGKTSSMEMIRVFAQSIAKAFSIDTSDIKLNDPFKGGYITQVYGNNPIPWIQVEMNRSLYLSDPWFDKDTLTIDSQRLKKLNQMFENALDLFTDEVKMK